MKNLVSKNLYPANIFVLISLFFSATVILADLKTQPNQGLKMEEALLFDKTVRKAKIFQVVADFWRSL